MSGAATTTWWNENWKWLLPIGCLSAVLMSGGFVAGAILFVHGLMSSNDAYVEAMERARAHPGVVEALGSPIEDGYFGSGSVETSSMSGRASLEIPISGPKGSATIYVEAEKSAGQWQFTFLVVAIDGSNRRIDLLIEDGTAFGAPRVPV